MNKPLVIKIFIAVSILLWVFPLYANNSISIPDTTIPRGSIYEVPIYVNTENLEAVLFDLVLEFDAYVIDIKSVEAGTNTNFSNLDYNINLFAVPAQIRISCANLTTSGNSALFSLKIEGLAGSDTITTLTPLMLWINKVIQSNFTFNEGTIVVPGNPIFKKETEYLNQNYPNPFDWYTTFPFSLKNSTNISFLVYSIEGRESFPKDDILEFLTIYKENEDGSKQPLTDFEGYLEKGKYQLLFAPAPWILASGKYLFIMKTDKDVYSKQFMYVK